MSKRVAFLSNRCLLQMLLGERLREWQLAGSVQYCHAPEEIMPGTADLVLLDADAANGDLPRTLRSIRKRAGKIRVVLLAGCSGGYLAHLAVQMGLGGVLHKADSIDDFQDGMRAVLAGGMFFSPLVDQGRRGLFARVLSDREITVMAAVASGESNTQIARRLGISVATVRTHRRNGMQKVGVKTQLELARFAVSQGLIRFVDGCERTSGNR